MVDFLLLTTIPVTVTVTATFIFFADGRYNGGNCSMRWY
jgi:hypothetical protein